MKKMYIMDEKQTIEGIIRRKEKPKDMSMMMLIHLLAKKDYEESTSHIELTEMVQNRLATMQLNDYQEYKWHDKILNLCLDMYSDLTPSEFKIREYIPFYTSEWQQMYKHLRGDRHKKLMFTFYILARYENCNGWINRKDSDSLTEVFRIANLGGSSDENLSIVHRFYEAGLINLSKRVDNLNIQVLSPHRYGDNAGDDQDEILYKVPEIKNLGNQYVSNFKDNYRPCIRCGRPVKRTSPRRCYCGRCSKERKNERNRLFMQQWRKEHH